ncbi:MAG: myo-inositol-1(or 4)-monophosphatase [Planctomycetota bacterium]|jgi:myo-inositol-1(or 4)-monophosphatase
MDLRERQLAVDLGTKAAREAGALLLEYLERIDRVKLKRKSHTRDLVTEADLASERLLVAQLREAFPGHAIEAEEETCDPESDQPRWFLDPLDGTVNYVHRLPFFCVSMGLYVGTKPQVAVVHAPLLGETFCAVLGGGAWMEGPRGSGKLATSRVESLGEAVLATGFPYRRESLENNNLGNFQELFCDLRGIRRMGSAALDLAYVAAGRLDGYWELHLAPHDVAAGALLVREAGGIVSDAHGGEDWLRGGSVVAAGPGLQGQLQARIQA